MADVPIKYPYVGGKRWAFMAWADIPDARDEKYVYLRRLRVCQTPWFALYLHFIFKKDDDRDPHDHPFRFWSLIVRGGYTERLFRINPRIDKDQFAFTRRWNRWSWHKMDQKHAHMICDLDPGTITLVVCGPKRRNVDSEAEWGFYTQQGFVPWKQYNRAKYSEDSLA